MSLWKARGIYAAALRPREVITPTTTHLPQIPHSNLVPSSTFNSKVPNQSRSWPHSRSSLFSVTQSTNPMAQGPTFTLCASVRAHWRGIVVAEANVPRWLPSHHVRTILSGQGFHSAGQTWWSCRWPHALALCPAQAQASYTVAQETRASNSCATASRHSTE
jgi:hypothetical protein